MWSDFVDGITIGIVALGASAVLGAPIWLTWFLFVGFAYCNEFDHGTDEPVH